MSARIPGRALLGGAVVAVILFVPIAVAVVVLERYLIAEATRRDQAFGGILLVTGGSILALGAGGWVAGRAAGSTTAAGDLGGGLATGVVAVGALVGLTYAVLGETMDFHSVGVALGVTEIPATDLNGAPFPPDPAGSGYDTSPPDLAWRRTLTGIAFVTVWALLAVTAAALGALAGASRRRFGSPG